MAETAGRGPAILTTRQVEILTLAAEGCPNDEIGRRLWLTVETVKTHLRRIARALGSRNRAHSVALAMHAGILPAGSEQASSDAATPTGYRPRHVDFGWPVILALTNGRRLDCRIVAVDSSSVLVALAPFGRLQRLHQRDVLGAACPLMPVRAAQSSG